MKDLGNESASLDHVDSRLLRALCGNARVSTAELARMVGMSAPAVAERVRRMEEAGVIAGYAARPGPAALGLPVAAWLRIRPLPGELARVAEIIRARPEIVLCDRITGEDCFLAKAHLRSLAELEAMIDEIIPFAMTTTSIVQSSPVPERPPRLGVEG